MVWNFSKTSLLNYLRDWNKLTTKPFSSYKKLESEHIYIDSVRTITLSFTFLTLLSSSFCLSNITVLWILPDCACNGRGLVTNEFLCHSHLLVTFLSRVHTLRTTYPPDLPKLPTSFPHQRWREIASSQGPGKCWRNVKKATERLSLVHVYYIQSISGIFHYFIQLHGTTQEVHIRVSQIL